MKKTALALAAILLTGCGYSHDEVKTSIGICKSYGGEHSFTTTGSTITNAYCTVDKIRYRIGRTNGQLLEGEVL